MNIIFMYYLYLSPIFLPLISSIIVFCFSHKLGSEGVKITSIFCLSLAWLISIYLLLIYLSGPREEVIIITLLNWIEVGSMHVKWEILYDIVTYIMAVMILTVSLCVHIYTEEYLNDDPNFIKFIKYLGFFTFFMLIVVSSSSILQLLVGWEGVGLCSYLLVNFWYTRIAANKAAMKALIINKIGDVCFLLGLILFFGLYETFDFGVINCSSWMIKKIIYLDTYIAIINIDYLTPVLFLFVLGACAKSAQIGLHTWLPDAMEGPTPVSALIHAATMVTAGIFLLLRLAQLLKYDLNILLFVSFLGAITAVVAATIGVFQNDIKKIIAYSTCSQLGYMMLACGLNNYSGSFFHLINHAFFKALLFLSAGAIIHSMFDQQDVRRMGMLLKYLPVSYIMILVGSLTIMGIPFLSGFYSKDFILEYVYSSNIFISIFLYWLGIISASLTAMYSIKLLFLTFYNVHNSYFNIIYNKKEKIIKIKESKLSILIALVFLFFGSIFIGYILKDLFIGMGTDIWSNSLGTESYKDNMKIFEVEFLPMRIKIIPIIFTFLSILISFLIFNFYWIIVEKLYIIYFNICNIYTKKEKIKFGTFIKIIQYIKKFFYNGYYFNEIYNSFLYKKKNLSYNLLKDLDRGIIEFFGYLTIVNTIKNILSFFSKKHKNRIDYIVFVMIIGIIIIFFIILIFNVSNYKVLGLILLLIILELKKDIK